MRYLKWFAGGFLAIVFMVAAGMLVPRPLFPHASASDQGQAMRQILVISNPIHTDLAFPLDDETLRYFPFLEAEGLPVRHPMARWIIFGWGGRAFYLETPTWGDLKPMPVVKSLTLDQSVMHVEVVGELNLPNPAIYSIAIPKSDFDRMARAVAASFRVSDGAVQAIPNKSYGRSDRFFEANGFFNALLGCNTWTASMLREAGLRTGLWNPLPVSLVRSLAMFNG
jgi:uncharacterized protein (TIGR02117 family)